MSQKDWKINEMNANILSDSPAVSPTHKGAGLTKFSDIQPNSADLRERDHHDDEPFSPMRKRSEYNQEEVDLFKILSDHRGFKIVNTLKAGTSFGEIAIRMQVPRMATVVCKESTTFGVLKGETFQRIMRLFNEKVSGCGFYRVLRRERVNNFRN